MGIYNDHIDTIINHKTLQRKNLHSKEIYIFIPNKNFHLLNALEWTSFIQYL